jgi:DNA-binding HxlR family transcriptional regulator
VTSPAYLPEDCSIARTLHLIGERWTLLVLREAFRGTRRFDDLRANTGAPRQVLSARLATLVSHGILRQVPYQVLGQRQRNEYRLTRKGMDLYPVLVALTQWGDQYVADPAGPPVHLTHANCGASVRATLTCEDGHRLESAKDVHPVLRQGPVPADQP